MSHFYPKIHSDRLSEVLRRLPKEIILESLPLKAEAAVTPEPVPYANRETLSYQPIQEGALWGKTWDCGWFRLQGRIPQAWAGSYVTMRLDLGGETLVYDAEGCPWVGLTSGSVFDARYSKDTMHLFPQGCKGGEVIDLWVEAGANTLFGVTRAGDPEWTEDKANIHGKHEAHAAAMRLCRFDYDKWQLWLDLEVLHNLIHALPENAVRRIQILRVCSEALDLLPTQGVPACRQALRPLFGLGADPATVDVYGVGHAHIDTAWLWPVRETIRKCSRTFASQIGLIERYPGYVFGASQAQLYAFTKQHYPALYAKIKHAVAQGTWEVQGGMWVEADCNLIGGESMVRQFVHGKNFFRDEFGVDVRNLWLPDVFGYSGNLPQILRKAGMEYFLTQKLSWNRYNTFPHNTFIWRGIDGSEVLAHFPPEDNYNSHVMPEGLRRNELNNKEAGLVQEAICLFGVGDGGGGPKEEHIERGLRCRNLNGVPRFHFGHAQRVLEKMAAYGKNLSTWSGELYFELHRATLTTQAGIKRWNRRAEEALRAAEMLCATASVNQYPVDVFDRMWKTVLLNQFHDIIPGSSIHRVYEEAIPELQDVTARCAALQQGAARRMLKTEKESAVLFNPSSTDFVGAIALPAGWTGAAWASGDPAPVQKEKNGVVLWARVPARGFVTLRRNKNAPDATITACDSSQTELAEFLTLENAQVRYLFDANLRLLSAFDKETGVDLVPREKPGNALELFDDHPQNWDAWDIDEYYSRMRMDVAHAQSIERISGTVRTGLCATLRIGQSTLVQTIWLGREGKRLDFVTQADWHESHKLLRVAFPTTLVAREASFEIQYGHVRRATHDNTKMEYAQFEVVGHRWADLSQRNAGVALLNDSKYGYRVKEGTLELSLLRASTEPDPVADRGEHQFTYSFLPHAGDLVDSDVNAHAAIINQGVLILEGVSAMPETALPVSVTGHGIELAVLKRAEKESCLVVRLVETRGVHTTGELTCADSTAKIVSTDLMEWKDETSASTGRVAISFTPFEIKTFKIRS